MRTWRGYSDRQASREVLELIELKRLEADIRLSGLLVRTPAPGPCRLMRAQILACDKRIGLAHAQQLHLDATGRLPLEP